MKKGQYRGLKRTSLVFSKELKLALGQNPPLLSARGLVVASLFLEVVKMACLGGRKMALGGMAIFCQSFDPVAKENILHMIEIWPIKDDHEQEIQFRSFLDISRDGTFCASVNIPVNNTPFWSMAAWFKEDGSIQGKILGAIKHNTPDAKLVLQ